MAFPAKVPGGMRLSGWEITSSSGRIMESRCARNCAAGAGAGASAAAAGAGGEAAPGGGEADAQCDFCRYERELELPSLPEEVYATSFLRLKHVATGGAIEFSALDALRGVDAKRDLVKVAYAADWSTARARPGAAGRDLEVHKPYDWTFTTDYAGTVPEGWPVRETDEEIDYEALRRREPILHHAECNLFGDDFGDNGEVLMSARVRVMPTSFFALQRLFVRVDGVLVRVIDTRLYHRFGDRHLIRERTVRETPTRELERKFGIEGDPVAAASLYKHDHRNQLVESLPVVSKRNERIDLPDAPAAVAAGAAAAAK